MEVVIQNTKMLFGTLSLCYGFGNLEYYKKKLGRMLGLTYNGNGNYHFMVIVIVMEVLIENIQYTIQTID